MRQQEGPDALWRLCGKDGIMKQLKKDIYNDVWFFYKKYLDGDGTDQYWDNLVHEAQEIVDKYGQDKFSRELIGAVINELAREK